MESRTLLVVLLSLLSFASLQSAPSLDSRIVGGTAVEIEAYPYQASLYLNSRFICGASIIAQDKLLTAAHCTYDTNHSLLSVRVGASNILDGTTYELREVIEHPRYSFITNANDVSVLRLKTLLEFGPKVRPIALATQRPPVGRYQFISGYGETSKSRSGPNRTLQGTKVPIMSQSRCQDLYPRQVISSAMVCAGYRKGGRDSCQGDSGGPMVDIVTKQQTGVVSWGDGCAQRKKPGVYASIPDLLDFIQSVK